jgi:hypothetical protein
MPEFITQELYKGEIQIKFFEASHQYWKDGKRLSGVTAYTGQIDKSRALIKWAENLSRDYLKDFLGKKLTEKMINEAVTQHQVKKEEAGDIGKLVHNWNELYIKYKISNGEKPVYPDSEEAMKGIIAFLDWESQNNVQWLKSEQIVYSKKYNYVGTADAIAVINGVKYLVDFKTGKAVYPEAHLQVTGYINAHQEEYHELLRGKILHFDKFTGDFEEQEVKLNIPVFVGLVNLKEYLKNF